MKIVLFFSQARNHPGEIVYPASCLSIPFLIICEKFHASKKDLDSFLILDMFGHHFLAVSSLLHDVDNRIH